MYHNFIFILVGLLTFATGCTESVTLASDIESLQQKMSDIDRGRYVIVIMGCNDCHTPDYLVRRSNVPEESWLVGSTLGFHNALGTFYPTNLRLLINGISEEEWLVLAKQMRKETPMADVMLPETADHDLRSIYRFIQYLGPKGVREPARLPKGVVPTTQYIETPVPH